MISGVELLGRLPELAVLLLDHQRLARRLQVEESRGNGAGKPLRIHSLRERIGYHHARVDPSWIVTTGPVNR